MGRVCWQRSTRRPRKCRSGCSLLSVPLGARTVHPTTACTVRWSFCDSSFAIMVLKAPSEPSGKQELRARRAAPGPHGTRPPSNSACRCQPSFRFSATGLFHPARLDWPLCFAPALLIALACACIACTRMHAPPTHCSSCALMLLSPAQLFAGSRTRASPPHCSLRARMLLSPPMARVFPRS